MDWNKLGEMLHEPLTQLVVLAVVLAYYTLCYTTRIASGNRRVRKQGKDWSWKQFWSDIADRLQAIFVLVGLIIGSDMTQWLAPLIGITLDEAVSSALNSALIIAIPFVAGLAELYAAARNTMKLWGWQKNILALNMDENKQNYTTENYDKIANTVYEFIDTITPKTAKEDFEETLKGDGKVVDVLDYEEIEPGKGGISNTYPNVPQPYRTAPQDTITDPSTCWNREAQPAGTLITLEDGSYRAVEDIKIGDRLWNHDATEIVTVKSLWMERKPVYNITTGLGEIRFTGEHPLYARSNKWSKIARGSLSAFASPKFTKVKDLKIGDKVFVPELKGEELPLNENELKWLGFYLGDGTKATKTDRCPIYRLIVPDGRKREFIDSLGIKGSYSVHSHTEKAKYFTLAKKSAPELRKILDEIDGKSFGRLVTPEQAKYIVEGYLQADGCLAKENIYTASSTDRKLLMAIQRMVLSMGGTMSIRKRYDEGELEKFGATVHAKALWEANINLAPKRSRVHTFKDGKYATITKIELGTEEDVYNIEVSGSHTYIADNHGVHNCVSYCAAKIYELTGKWPIRTGGMSAKYWVQRLAENGYTKIVDRPVNGGKYVGVTDKGQYGHVVWFEEGSTVSEYNYLYRGGFSARNIDLSAYKWVEIQAPTTPATPAAPDKKPTKKDPTIYYTYKQGDTFGQVITDLGLKTSHGLWGADGDIAYYNKQLATQGITGNIPVGMTIKLTPRE